MHEWLVASSSAEREARKEGEAKIKEACKDPQRFVKSLAEELTNEQSDVEVRQMAAIVLKNFIRRDNQVWVMLDFDFKAQIKNSISSCLQADKNLVRKQAA